MSPSRRGPRSLAVALEVVRSDWEPETRLAQVQRVWGQVVGAAIAAEASPVRAHGGVLTISCSASVWAQELDLMGPSIVARLNERLEESSIERLRCVAVPDPRR